MDKRIIPIVLLVLIAGFVVAQTLVIDAEEIYNGDVIFSNPNLGAYIINFSRAVFHDDNSLFTIPAPVMVGHSVLSTMQDPYNKSWTWEADHNTVNGFTTGEYSRDSDITLLTPIVDSESEVVGSPGTYWVHYSTIDPCTTALMTCE